jgi:hypothetical protein
MRGISKQNWVPWKANVYIEMGERVLKVKVGGQEKRTKEESNFSKIEATCTNTTIALRYGHTETRLELKYKSLKSDKLVPKN